MLKLIRLSDGCYDRIPVRKLQSINSIVNIKNLFQSRVMSRSSLPQSNEVFVTRKLSFCENAHLTGNENSSDLPRSLTTHRPSETEKWQFLLKVFVFPPI